ncbi:MAG TPA: acyl-CoA dehydrogenase family protein, partial [Burkholderiaceae bacterium]|nr:acyl-CoA dehydrogenase family protein [Burkholderiaceae bacterium]
STLEAVAEYLAEREALLVLDNFEQILDAGATVAALTAAGRRLTILTTSRTPLGIRGEQVFPAPPLPLPPPDHDHNPPDIRDLAANDAIQLCGHYGYTTDAPLERMYRDARNWGLAGGSMEVMRNTIASRIYGRRFDRRAS